MIRLCLVTLCALFLFPVAAWAALLEVGAPKTVYTGTAFAIDITTDSPDPVTISWRKAKLVFTPKRLERPEGAPAAFGGQVLLPVSLDAEPGSARLSCVQQAADSGAYTADISIQANTFETQRLTVESKYVTPPQEVLDRIEQDRTRSRAAYALRTPSQYWELPFYRPVSGTVSSSFGLRRVFNEQPRSPHMGLDLRGPQGTPIHACADGVVALAEEQYYSGNCVFIDHGMGVVTTYLHMSAIHVQAGETVQRGQVIGLVGATGRVTGPHLHLGLSVLGVMVDPLPLLESRPQR